MGKTKEVYIKLDAPYRIKYEEHSDFDSSIFSPVYRQAAQITEEIVRKNQEYYSNPIQRGNVYRNNEQIYNIISFVGGRGSGKTSTMLSFAEYLKDYHRFSGEHLKTGNYYVGKDLTFIGVSAIDAGLLEKKEDIIEVVLAKLLGEFRALENKGVLSQKSDYEVKRREFNQCLQKIYNSNQKRRNDNVTAGEYGSVNALYEMAVSINMRESIKELVKSYIGLMSERFAFQNVQENNCFIVIPIDDIDMNIEYGYEMLEQIRRYLMVPNVIVLLSYRYEQLQDICNLYYLNKEKELGRLEEQKNLAAKIEDLSRFYMAKVVPDGRRITFPTIKKEERLNGNAVKIIPVGDQYEKKDAHSLEETFLRKTARCFGFRSWHPKNGGRFFWDVENIRDLCNRYNELHVLTDPFSVGKEGRLTEKEIYQMNYFWLFGHLEHRAENELNESDLQLFRELMEQSSDKINSFIQNKYEVETKSGDLEGQNLGITLQAFHALDCKVEQVLLKDLTVNYFSAVIGKKCIGEIDNEDILQLERMIGGADWMGTYYNAHFLPSINYRSYGSFADKSSNISPGYTYDICCGDGYKKSFELSDEKQFRRMELFCLFISNPSRIVVNVSTEKRNKYQVNMTVTSFDFCATGFFWNVFNYRNHLQFFHEKIKNALEEFGLNNSDEKNRRLQRWDTMAGQMSIRTELDKWVSDYGSAQLIPFCNLEFIGYLAEECICRGSESLFEYLEEETGFEKGIVNRKEWDSILLLINKVEELLKRQDSFYEKARRTEDKEGLRSLSERFSDCPFIKAVRNITDEDWLLDFEQWIQYSGNFRDNVEKQ